MGGSRSDRRLRAVADALGNVGIACLRFDYGPWDEGRGERSDAGRAVAWASERYARVGLFGYSFGGAIALLAAADRDDIGAVAALAPAAELGPDLDAVATLPGIGCPVLVVGGERDETADWERVGDRARELGHEVVTMGADHHFVGQEQTVGERVAAFFERTL